MSIPVVLSSIRTPLAPFQLQTSIPRVSSQEALPHLELPCNSNLDRLLHQPSVTSPKMCTYHYFPERQCACTTPGCHKRSDKSGRCEKILGDAHYAWDECGEFYHWILQHPNEGSHVTLKDEKDSKFARMGGRHPKCKHVHRNRCVKRPRTDRKLYCAACWEHREDGALASGSGEGSLLRSQSDLTLLSRH